MEFIRDGHVVGFDRITSPINNNPNQTKTIRLIREHNPTLTSRLPGPAWVIMQTEMLLDMDIMRSLPGGFTNPPVRSLTPKGSFVTQNEANTRLQQIAAELGTAERTVKAHRAHVMQKMQAASVAELVHFAEQLGLNSAAKTATAQHA